MYKDLERYPLVTKPKLSPNAERVIDFLIREVRCGGMRTQILWSGEGGFSASAHKLVDCDKHKWFAILDELRWAGLIKFDDSDSHPGIARHLWIQPLPIEPEDRARKYIGPAMNFAAKLGVIPKGHRPKDENERFNTLQHIKAEIAMLYGHNFMGAFWWKEGSKVLLDECVRQGKLSPLPPTISPNCDYERFVVEYENAEGFSEVLHLGRQLKIVDHSYRVSDPSPRQDGPVYFVPRAEKYHHAVTAIRKYLSEKCGRSDSESMKWPAVVAEFKAKLARKAAGIDIDIDIDIVAESESRTFIAIDPTEIALSEIANRVLVTLHELQYRGRENAGGEAAVREILKKGGKKTDAEIERAAKRVATERPLLFDAVHESMLFAELSPDTISNVNAGKRELLKLGLIEVDRSARKPIMTEFRRRDGKLIVVRPLLSSDPNALCNNELGRWIEVLLDGRVVWTGRTSAEQSFVVSALGMKRIQGPRQVQVNASPEAETLTRKEKQIRKVANKLGIRERSMLIALFELEAFGRESLNRLADVASKAEGPSANHENFKPESARLRRLKLTKSVSGRSGGLWLTELGRRIAEFLNKRSTIAA